MNHVLSLTIFAIVALGFVAFTTTLRPTHLADASSIVRQI
jgi:hypothetical protein